MLRNKKIVQSTRVLILAIVLYYVTGIMSTPAQDLREAHCLSEEVTQLYHQGRYCEAICYAEQALNLCERTLGSDHPSVATSLQVLAELYRKQNQYVMAEQLYERALAIRKKTFEMDHPDVATSLNNLAVLYHEQGRYDRAEKLYKRALTIYENVLGQDHNYVSTCRNNLSELYHGRGIYDNAEFLVQKKVVNLIEP